MSDEENHQEAKDEQDATNAENNTSAEAPGTEEAVVEGMNTDEGEVVGDEVKNSGGEETIVKEANVEEDQLKYSGSLLENLPSLIIGGTTVPGSVVGPSLGGALLFVVVIVATIATSKPPPPPPKCIVDFNSQILLASALPKSEWSEWSDFSECSVTCGQGENFRTRNCTSPNGLINDKPVGDCKGQASETSECSGSVQENCQIDGQWSEWSSYSDCSTTCGNGTTFSTRSCDNPAPQYNGADCQGEDSNTIVCPDNPKCPVDGQWSDWGTYGGCSVTCGQGVKIKRRTCDNPAPQNNGADCVGEGEQSRNCAGPDCAPEDGGWTTWTSWSPCSQTVCGVGRKSKERTCSNPEPKYGGKACDGDNYQFKLCTHKTMPVCAACLQTLNEALGGHLRVLNQIPGEWLNVFAHMRIPENAKITRVQFYARLKRNFFMAFWQPTGNYNFQATKTMTFRLKKKVTLNAEVGMNDMEMSLSVRKDWILGLQYPYEGAPITDAESAGARGTIYYEVLPKASSQAELKYMSYMKRILDDNWQIGFEQTLTRWTLGQKTAAILVDYECT